jgi:hypothetical protein
MRFMYPKVREKIGVVPGGAKTNRMMEHTAGAPKCMIPYGNHAIKSRKTFLWAERILLRFAP